jgi:two-component system response regulator AtoC
LLIAVGPYGSSEVAMETMKRGAYDYLPKPFTADEVVLTLRKAEEREKRRSRERFGALDCDLPEP